MNIYSWNVNGIRAIKNKGFLEWVHEEQPDILCLQETKAHVSQLDESLIHIDGYYSYWNAPERKGYSGVATYSKQQPLSVKYGIGIDWVDEEGRIIITEFKDFILLNIYFPNGQMNEERLQYKLKFYDQILKYCEGLRANGAKIIISGDFNTAHQEIDLKNPKPNEKYSGFLPIERQWIDELIKHGYVDTFRYLHPDTVKYSWWSYRFKARERNAGWRIDYHFISDNLLEQIEGADILTDVVGSDHCPIVVKIQ